MANEIVRRSTLSRDREWIWSNWLAQALKRVEVQWRAHGNEEQRENLESTRRHSGSVSVISILKFSPSGQLRRFSLPKLPNSPKRASVSLVCVSLIGVRFGEMESLGPPNLCQDKWIIALWPFPLKDSPRFGVRFGELGYQPHYIWPKNSRANWMRLLLRLLQLFDNSRFSELQVVRLQLRFYAYLFVLVLN